MDKPSVKKDAQAIIRFLGEGPRTPVEQWALQMARHVVQLVEETETTASQMTYETKKMKPK